MYLIAIPFLLVFINVIDATSSKKSHSNRPVLDLNRSPPQSPKGSEEVNVIESDREGVQLRTQMESDNMQGQLKHRRQYRKDQFPPGTSIQEKRRTWNQAYQKSLSKEYRNLRSMKKRKCYAQQGREYKEKKAKSQQKYYNSLSEDKKKKVMNRIIENQRSRRQKMTEEELKVYREKRNEIARKKRAKDKQERMNSE